MQCLWASAFTFTGGDACKNVLTFLHHINILKQGFSSYIFQALQLIVLVVREINYKRGFDFKSGILSSIYLHIFQVLYIKLRMYFKLFCLSL